MFLQSSVFCDSVTQMHNNSLQLKGSVKEPNKFRIYETEKITRKGVTQQNISSCSVLSPEIIMHNAFNVIL